MVLIDGKEVNDNIIDPAKHKYIGMFRKPMSIVLQDMKDIRCTCGSLLLITAHIRDHWYNGHFDIPQYETIEREESIEKDIVYIITLYGEQVIIPHKFKKKQPIKEFRDWATTDPS